MGGLRCQPCPVRPWLCDLGKPCWLWASRSFSLEGAAVPSEATGCRCAPGIRVLLSGARLRLPASPNLCRGWSGCVHHSTLLSLFRLDLKICFSH